MSELVLASASAVRASVLKNAGIPFRIEPEEEEEDAEDGPEPLNDRPSSFTLLPGLPPVEKPGA